MTRSEAIETLRTTYEKKNLAYGNSAHDTFEEWGAVAYYVRISDKLNRIRQLESRHDIDTFGESLMDTYGDCATYALMLRADFYAKAVGVTFENAMRVCWDDIVNFVIPIRTIQEWRVEHTHGDDKNPIAILNDDDEYDVLCMASYMIDKYVEIANTKEGGKQG